jgi:hypothetical protein
MNIVLKPLTTKLKTDVQASVAVGTSHRLSKSQTDYQTSFGFVAIPGSQILQTVSNVVRCYVCS